MEDGGEQGGDAAFVVGLDDVTRWPPVGWEV